MTKNLSIIAGFVAVAISVGCDRRALKEPVYQDAKGAASKHHVVRWTGGVSLYSIVLTVDGVTLGRGAQAYKLLLSTLSSFPDESHLEFRYPLDISNLLEDYYQYVGELPFDKGFEAERVAFDELCLRKRFTTEIHCYRQTEFLGDKEPQMEGGKDENGVN